MQSSSVVIHCQPSLLEDIKDQGYLWSYSKQFGTEEIDVIVDDIPGDITDEGYYQDPDVEICDHYGINYDLINCIEAVY